MMEDRKFSFAEPLECRAANCGVIEMPELNVCSVLCNLPLYDCTVGEHDPAHSIDEKFTERPDLPGVIVMGDEKLLGMISRSKFLQHLSRQFGLAVFLNRPIHLLLEIDRTQALVLPADERIETTVRKAFARTHELIYDPIVVKFQNGELRLLDVRVLLTSLSRILAIQNDEIRKAQDELIRMEKMTSLSQLVAGVAHEINTPIGISLTAASHLAEKTSEIRAKFDRGEVKKSDFKAYTDLAIETADLMLSNINRAASLTRSFKQVAVDQTSDEFRQFEMKGYIHKVLLNLGPQLKKTPHRIRVICPDDLIMRGYPGAFSQVLTNLVQNALLHAFPDCRNGEISIRVTIPDDQSVEVAFSDNGCGVPENHQKRVFDPFFTTKRGNGGSGLGLHIVYNIVTHTFKGRISLESKAGAGTLFRMRFPRVLPDREESDVCQRTIQNLPY